MKQLLILLLAVGLQAKHLHKEKYYQEAFCNKMGGKTEVMLSDLTRVDCMTSEFAIEVDFAEKWAESIGQSLYYGLRADKRPAVYLILEREKDEKYLRRLKSVAIRHGIEVFYDK